MQSKDKHSLLIGNLLQQKSTNLDQRKPSLPGNQALLSNQSTKGSSVMEHLKAWRQNDRVSFTYRECKKQPACHEQLAR
eukprot:1158994-Pelagomonas_calceolata.AAC.2